MMGFAPKNLVLSVIFYFILFTNSYTDATLGGPCEWANHCNDWILECSNFVCVCPETHIPDPTNTFCVIPIGGVCRTNTDTCYDTNAVCDPFISPLPRLCRCRENFRADPETGVCHRALDSSCTTDGLPCVSGSCIDGKCQCPDGLIASANKNRCGLATDASCSVDGPQCAEDLVECNPTSNICECPEFYQSATEDGSIVCKWALGAACNTTDECAVNDVTCETMRDGAGYCTCTPGFVPSEDRKSCIPVTTHWPGTCEENLQCSAMFGRHGFCQEGACACASGYVYVPEDFGCSPIHTVADHRIYENMKSLASALLPFVPAELKSVVDDIIHELQ